MKYIQKIEKDQANLNKVRSKIAMDRIAGQEKRQNETQKMAEEKQQATLFAIEVKQKKIDRLNEEKRAAALAMKTSWH